MPMICFLEIPNGTVYEVDASLVGHSVTIKHDPAKPGAPVDIWLDGKKIQTAKVVDIYTNCRVKRNHDSKVLRAVSHPNQPESKIKLRDMQSRKETP